MSASRRWPASTESVVLAVIVALGCFVPRGGDSPTRRVQHWFGVHDLPHPVTSAVFAALALVAVFVLPRSRWPLYLVAVLAWLLRSIWPPLIVAVYAGASAGRRPAHTVAVTVAGTAVAVLPEYVGVGLGVPGVPPSALFTAFGAAALFVWAPAAVGTRVSARRRATAAVHAALHRHARERQERADRVRAEERARIARDMHDVVAHRVSLMVLHAGALEVNAADARTTAAASLIRSIGRDALTQLRDVLGVLKSADDADDELRPRSTLADLDTLLEQSRSAGVPVSRRDEGEVRDLPVVVVQTAHRVVREALTNVHKHAGLVETEVVVRYSPDALEVDVVNRAPHHPPADPLPGSGLGLVGLRERVELVGGWFSAGPRAGGFTVSARVPLGAFGQD